MGGYIKNKKNMNFQSLDALQPIVNIVNEATEALNDSNRTIRQSPISEVLAGAIGAGIGSTISFTALYGLGTVGLSAAGIVSGLATAGAGLSAVIGGALSPMVAGVFVLAAPVAVVAAGGVGVASHLKYKQLKQEKERLYQEVLKKHQAIIKAQKEALNESEERQKLLTGLNVMLEKALKELKQDLGYTN